MNWLKNYFSSGYISWRLVEWIIILADLISVNLGSNPFVTRPYLLLVNNVFSAIFLSLSFVFPINRPMWQRKAYIAIEISLISTALLFGNRFDLLKCFIWAKACFLLRRRDAIIAIVFTAAVDLLATPWTAPELIVDTQAFLEQIDPVSTILLNKLKAYVSIGFFVTLFMFLLVAESKSRKKAEALTQEVEILATVVERNRIARDIHDSLGHTLTTLGVQLELAQKLHGINSTKATQALKNAQQLASQSLIEVRNTVSAIRSENFNLDRALNSLVNQFQRDLKATRQRNRLFEIQMELDLPPIPLPTSHQIYCIVKEALHNVQKHSQAERVTIKSKTNSQDIVLEIADNGIGFDSQTVTSGMGLQGMLERSQLINGQLKIDTARQKGTRIQLTIPVETFSEKSFK